MIPEEARLFLDKAKACLARGKTILEAGVGGDAGRNAYLAGFHATQALIFARTGKIAKTHRSVHSEFSKLVITDTRLIEFRSFLRQTCELKAAADYETGADADVPLERADAALQAAPRFVGLISEMLA